MIRHARPLSSLLDRLSDSVGFTAQRREPWWRYGAAVLAVLLATLVRILLDPLWEDHYPFTLYFIAIVFAGWYGGFRPAVVALILSTLLAAYLFFAPRYSFVIDGTDQVVALGTYVVLSFGIALIVESQHRAVQRAKVSEEEATQKHQALEREVRERRRIEEAWRGSEWRLHQVLNATRVGFWDLDLQTGRSLHRSLHHDRIFGYEVPLSEWSLELFLDRHVYPDDRARIEQTFREALATGKDWEFECRIVRADGSLGWIWAKGGVYVRNESGEPLRMSGLVMDVTERKRAEEQKAWLAAIVAHTDDAIIGKSLDGLITSWNAGAERLYGYTAAEIVGQPATILLTPDRADEVDRILQQVRQGNPIEHFESIRRRKDGTLVAVALTESAVRDDSGAIIGVSVIARDITDKKQTEESLRQSEARLHAIIDNMSEGVIFSDPSGLLMHWNQAALRLHGFSNAEEGNRRLPEFLSLFALTTLDGQPVSFEEWPLPRILRGERLSNYDLNVHHLDQHWTRTFSYSGDTVTDFSGRKIAFLTIHDITERRRAEEALAASERRSRAMVEQSIVGFYIIQDDRFVYVNPKLCEIVGYTAEELTSRPIYEFAAPEDRELVRTRVKQRLSGEVLALRYSLRMIRRDGQLITVDVHGTRAVHEGRPAVFGVMLDITQTRQAEEALRRSEQRYRSLVTATAQVVWTTDPEGNAHGPLPAWQVLTGQTEEELQGSGWMAVVHPDDQPFVRQKWEEALAQCRPFEVDYRLRRASGEYRDFHARGVPVQDSNGQIIEWVGTCTDITDRKRAEEALRESEARFRDLADNISQIAWMTDEKGAIVWYNRRWFEYTGTTLDEMQGWDWRDFHHPDQVDRVIERFNQCFANGEVWEDTFPLRGWDGNYRWFLSRAVPIRDDQGRVIRWFGTNTDITELREREEEIRRHAAELERVNRALHQKNEENEAFVYSVSHDLRAPLVNLQGFSKELSFAAEELRALYGMNEVPPAIREKGLSVLDGPVAKSIRFIQAAVTRLSTIIDSLLRLSRVGRVVYQRQPVEVQAIVAHVIDSLRGTAEERGAEIITGHLPSVVGDPAAIEQVFANLISNALKYLDPQRPGRVEVGTIPSAPDDAAAGLQTYYVRDNGLGIPASGYRKVFQPFQRLHPKAAPGEGMGLALIQRVVDRLGGRIWFESTVGEGSTFFVTLPTEEGQAPPAPSSGVVEFPPPRRG